LIHSLRQVFNSEWTPEKYGRFLGILEKRFGETTPFRHSETPCFLPESLVTDTQRFGQEIVQQLLNNPEYVQAAHRAIPEPYRAPNEDAVPLFVQADFGLDEERRLKLVEIQGFPSLYAYQPALADTYREAYGIPSHLASFPDELTASEYRNLLRRAIVAKHDPENVVLLELDPWHQKTRHDFVETERMLGIAVVDACAVRKRGENLFYSRDGKDIPIRRIYNRVIADEVERRGISLPFDFRDDLNVEWAGHPNWFFLLSKFSLPFLRHSSVPETVFLDQAPDNLDPSAYVLKPLYSFAGLGVTVGPTGEQLAAVPAMERHDYILQKRVNFMPSIETPEGATKVEIRVMYIWLDELRPVNLVIRMGRGAQMGVDHNKGFAWVGAAAAFIERGS
jgi:hypothetical protein